jgi:hypothetical protein
LQNENFPEITSDWESSSQVLELHSAESAVEQMGRIITEKLIVRGSEHVPAATDASTDEKTVVELHLRDRPLKEGESTTRSEMRFA